MGTNSSRGTYTVISQPSNKRQTRHASKTRVPLHTGDVHTTTWAWELIDVVHERNNFYDEFEPSEVFVRTLVPRKACQLVLRVQNRTDDPVKFTVAPNSSDNYDSQDMDRVSMVFTDCRFESASSYTIKPGSHRDVAVQNGRHGISVLAGEKNQGLAISIFKYIISKSS